MAGGGWHIDLRACKYTYGMHLSGGFDGIRVWRSVLGMVAANFKLPAKNIVVSIGPVAAKAEFVATGAAKQLLDMGFSLFATKATHEPLGSSGFQCAKALLKAIYLVLHPFGPSAKASHEGGHRVQPGVQAADQAGAERAHDAAGGEDGPGNRCAGLHGSLAI